MSKRSDRRREEFSKVPVEQKKESSVSQLFSGSSGRTSVADLILARAKLLKQKELQPTVQVAEPNVPIPIPTRVEAEQLEEGVQKRIISSERHKEMIFTEALANKKHYLARQQEAANRGLDKPWFYFTKKESQYSEFVELDAAMAQELIDHMWSVEEGNRKLKEDLSNAYQRDIESDRWIPSDESIGIDYNHVVYNGRHRLTAMTRTSKKWPFYITFNALEEAKFSVDSGAKRNSSEKLRMVVDTNLGNRTTGFCKAIMRGNATRIRYTETEIAEFAHKWQHLIQWISKNLPGGRAEVQAAIGKAYLYFGPEKIEPFCERFRDVKFTEDNDPARALFMTLQRSKINRTNVDLVAYKKTVHAIQSVMQDKGLSRVYERDEDIFQWSAPDWNLPAEAWANQTKQS